MNANPEINYIVPPVDQMSVDQLRAIVSGKGEAIQKLETLLADQELEIQELKEELISNGIKSLAKETEIQLLNNKISLMLSTVQEFNNTWFKVVTGETV